MNVNVLSALQTLKDECNRALDAVQLNQPVPFSLTTAYITVMEIASEADLAELPPDVADLVTDFVGPNEYTPLFSCDCPRCSWARRSASDCGWPGCSYPGCSNQTNKDSDKGSTGA